jgi:hypothetical protein
LGNLACWREAVFSVGPYAISKFPDLERSYEQALADLDNEPSDVRTRLRLAELELARHRPRQALQVIDAGQYALSADVRWASRARVRALLAMAADADTLPMEVESLLDRAWQAAVDSSDVLHAGTQRAQYLESSARPLEAARQYVQTITRVGDDLIDVDEHWRRQARGVLAEHVRGLRPALSERQFAALRADLRQLLSDIAESYAKEPRPYSALGREWLRQAGRLADAELDEEISNQADLWLARQYLSMTGREPFALAESHLNRVLGRNGSGADRAEALTRLARMYVYIGERLMPLPQTTTQTLEALAALGDQSVPSAWTGESKETTAAAWADHMLTQLPIRQLRFTAGAPALPERTDVLWQLDDPASNEIWPVHFAGPQSDALSDVLVCLTQSGLICVHLPDGQRAGWQVDMNIIDTSRRVEPGRSYQRGREPFGLTQMRGAIEGQVLLLASEDAIHAFEASTGRALWRLPAEDVPPASDEAISVRDGYAACLLSAHRLAVLPAATLLPERGHPLPIWQREFTEGALAWVRIVEDRVAVFDGLAEVVTLFELPTGELVAELPMGQSLGMGIEPIFLPGVVCGADRAMAVGYSLANGQRLWRQETAGHMTALFAADRELTMLGVGTATGHLMLLDPQTGQTRLNVRVPKARRVLDAVVEDDRITVFCEQPSADGEPEQFLLVGLDAETEQQHWRAGPFVRPAHNFSPELLRQSSDAVVLVQVGDPRGSYGGDRLFIIDKGDGAMSRHNMPDQQAVDVIVTSNKLILSMRSGRVDPPRLLAFGSADQEDDR